MKYTIPFFLLLAVSCHIPRKKVIDLPEEIQVAQKGDTLIVERTTKDSIIIGFKQKPWQRNH